MTKALFLGVLSFIILSIIILNVYKRHKNQKLIKSVTSLNRGTNSELNLILMLLKSGINSKSIFHDLIIKKENKSW